MLFHRCECQSGSLIKLPSNTVILKCEKTLDWINLSRENQLKKLIDRERATIVNGFWHKLFKHPTPTDEEVVKIIETPGDLFFIPETTWIKMSYWKSEEVAKRLLNAAKQANDIYVSTEDLEYLL